jgi:hypothetical protein
MVSESEFRLTKYKKKNYEGDTPFSPKNSTEIQRRAA